MQCTTVKGPYTGKAGRNRSRVWISKRKRNMPTCLVQVDVIEAQFALLMRRVAGACDFKEVERAHRAYLDALLSQSFLDMRQIAQMLEAVFTLCQRLCAYVQVGSPHLSSRPLCVSLSLSLYPCCNGGISLFTIALHPFHCLDWSSYQVLFCQTGPLPDY
jgi:hypothetical protein